MMTGLVIKLVRGNVHRYFRMSLRNMRFVKYYPSEALCECYA